MRTIKRQKDPGKHFQEMGLIESWGGGRRRGEARSRERGGNHGKRERGGHKISRRTVGGSLAIREAVTRQEWERAARK